MTHSLHYFRSSITFLCGLCVSMLFSPALAFAEPLHVCTSSSGMNCPEASEIFPSVESIALPGFSYSDTVPATLDLAEWAKDYYHGALALMLSGTTITKLRNSGLSDAWVPDDSYAAPIRMAYDRIVAPGEEQAGQPFDWCHGGIPQPCIDGSNVAQWAVYLETVRRSREMAGNSVSLSDQERELKSLRGVIAYDQFMSAAVEKGNMTWPFSYSLMLFNDLYRQLENNSRIKQVADEYVRWANSMMQVSDGYYNWYNKLYPEGQYDGVGGYFGVDGIRVAVAGYAGAPLANWFLKTGSTLSLDLSKKTSDYLLNYGGGRFWANPDPSRFFADPPVVFVGQTLGHPPAAESLLADARARLSVHPQDQIARQEVQKAKDVYEFMKRRANMGAIGMFGNPSALGVMLSLASELEDVRMTYPDIIPFSTYYEDVERWIRNQAEESRITAAFAATYIPSGQSGDERLDNIGNRAIGTFLSDATHGITRPRRPGFLLMDNNDGLWLMRGLYDVWKRAVEVFPSNQGVMIAWVNLDLNSATKYMDVYSDLPYRGRIVADLRQDIGPLKGLAVRIPSWAGQNVTIYENTGSGDHALQKGVRWDFGERYAVVNNIVPGAVYTVRFPLVVRHLTVTQRQSQDQWWSESPYDGNGFPETISTHDGTFIGDTMVDVTPRFDNGIQLYQRQNLKALINGNAVNEIAPPQRGVTRFVFSGMDDPPPPPPPPPPLSSVTLKVNNQDVLTTNGSYTLSWNSTNVQDPICTISYASSAGNGSFDVTANAPGAATTGLIGTFTMTCKKDGQNISKTVTITRIEPPQESVVDIKFNNSDGPVTIQAGASLKIDWVLQNVSGCTLAQVGPVPVSQNVTAPLSTTVTIGANYVGTTTQTITCQKPAGGTISDSATLIVTGATPPPTEYVTLLANGLTALTLAQPETYTLSWNSTGVLGAKCTISYSATNGATGSFEVDANVLGSAPTGLVGSYTMTCTSASGQPVSRTVTITLNSTSSPLPPTASLLIDGQPSVTVPAGQTFTVEWSSSNATSCALTNALGATSSTPPNTTTSNQGAAPSAGQTFTYKLSCTNAGGTTTKTATVTGQ